MRYTILSFYLTPFGIKLVKVKNFCGKMFNRGSKLSIAIFYQRMSNDPQSVGNLIF